MLTVRTFPDAVAYPITAGAKYTAKLKIIDDAVEVYISGGPENYNNLLVGTGPHAGIQNATVRANINIAATPASPSGQVIVKNYYVTDSLNFIPPDLDNPSLFYFKENYD